MVIGAVCGAIGGFIYVYSRVGFPSIAFGKSAIIEVVVCLVLYLFSIAGVAFLGGLAGVVLGAVVVIVLWPVVWIAKCVRSLLR